jgi:hypothetical protein
MIGLAFIGGGLYLAYQAWRKEFRQDRELGQMRARTRRVVSGLRQVTYWDAWRLNSSAYWPPTAISSACVPCSMTRP